MGDPLADDLVTDVFRHHEIGAVRQLLRHIVDNEHPLAAKDEGALPPHLLKAIEGFFEQSEAAASAHPGAAIERGQAFFARVGPEILLILACYSLPAAYAARKGVQVLAETKRLESEPNRRLFETTQMVIDVLRPGGLARGPSPLEHGVGLRTAQKVRLMHAAVRRLILEARGERFIEAYGYPINQEDLAGTLLTFSWIVLDGLDKMGIDTDEEDRQAYLETWVYVARILGVQEELLPATVAEAKALTGLVHERQIRESPEGKAMTRALLQMMRSNMPARWLSGLPPALLHFFLEDNAKLLGVPRVQGSVVLVRLLMVVARLADRLLGQDRWFAALYRRFNLGLMQAMVDYDRGGNRPSFEIPDRLADRWPNVPARLRPGAT